VSYINIGDVQVAQGDLAGALKSYKDGLAIADRLATSDPGNAGWQRDLSVNYAKLADGCRRSNQTVQAREALTGGRIVITLHVGDHQVCWRHPVPCHSRDRRDPWH
jgi:hypothetical protein